MKLFGLTDGLISLQWLQSRVRVSFGALLSTEAAARAVPNGWPDSLYNRVVLVADPRVSVVPVLDKWAEEGHPVEKKDLQAMAKQMRSCRRYTHALEISTWMSDRRYFSLSPGDLAVRLDLIHKVHGLEHAENYFNSIPRQLRVIQPCGALLNCYAEEKSVDKAEALFREMEPKVLTSFCYNALLKLYSQIGHHERVDIVFQEMKEKGFEPDIFTYNILMEAYADTSDIKGMENVLEEIKHHKFSADWHLYATAAKGYVKAEMMHKALAVLKRSEKLIPSKKARVAYGFLLTVYADMGNKSELYRIWNMYKMKEKTSNSMYMCMISGLLVLDDIEGAETILKEWESQFSFYDFRVPNLLVSAYCRKGLVGKAEALVNAAIESGRTPLANTWDRLAGAYFKNNQISRAMEMMNKTLEAGQPGWKPAPENVGASLKYFRDQKDVEAAEEFVKLLRRLAPLTREVYHCLLMTYLRAEKPVSCLLDRMKEDGFDADEETNLLLEQESHQNNLESLS